MADNTNLKTCKYCGREGLLWKRLGADRWALFEPDARGRAVTNHTAKCKLRPEVAGVNASADVGALINEQADAIGDFIDSASATLAAEQERAADEADKPTLPTYAPALAEATAEADEDADSFPVPELDPYYIIDASQLAAIGRVLALAEATGAPQNIGLHGPAGSGKTTLGLQVGALRGSPTIVIDSTDKETAADWFGTQALHEGNLTVNESDFVRAVETPDAVVVLDDVALIQARQVQNGLNALLDPSRRSIFVQQLNRTVTVAPRVIFVGTWNVGDEYTGASELSLQILDRFRAGALFEVPYPDDEVLGAIIRGRSACTRQDANRLSDAAKWLRNDPDPIICSTRGLVAAAGHLTQGATIGAALFFTVFGELDADTRQRAYTILSVNADRAGYPESEQARWTAPAQGQYVSIAAAVKKAAAGVPAHIIAEGGIEEEAQDNG